MYTVGSIADLISGKTTPNKPKVEVKEVAAKPFKTKPAQNVTPKKDDTPKKNKKDDPRSPKPNQNNSPKVNNSFKKSPQKRKGEPENNDKVKKPKMEAEKKDKPVSQNAKNAMKRMKDKNKERFADPEQDSRTIFVGNVPLTATKGHLKTYFSKFGKIQSIRFRGAARANLKIPKKAAYLTKQFHPKTSTQNAYVVFIDKETVDKSLEANGQLFKEHHIRVDKIVDRSNRNQKHAIFVGNLPFETKDDDLWTAFVDCGTIESVRLCRDKLTGMGKGYGYINFASADSVELALQMSDVKIKNRTIRIQRSVEYKKKNAQGEKIRKVPRVPQPEKKVKKPRQPKEDKPSAKEESEEETNFVRTPGFLKQLTEQEPTQAESSDNDEIAEEEKPKNFVSNPNKTKTTPKQNYAGMKFTDKKKKKKVNKTLLKKKKMSKMLAPKSS